MKKAIIFDWSGVIKDAVEGNLWISNKIFEKFSANKISLNDLRDNYELPYMKFFNKYVPSLTHKQEQELYKELIHSSECPESVAFPGIVNLIKQLKDKGYFLAVVSSDFPETLLKEIEHYGLSNIFDEVITDVHDKFEGVDKIIKSENLDLNNTFFIGDSNHEIEVAKKTNIKSIAVTWGFTSENKLKDKNPNYLVHNIGELEEILLK